MKLSYIFLGLVLLILIVIGWWFLDWVTDEKKLQEQQKLPPHTNEEIDKVTIFPELPLEYGLIDVPTTGFVNNLAVKDPSAQFTEVASSVYVDKYWINECQIKRLPVDRAFAMVAEPNPTLGLKQYQATEQAILNWESYVVRDVGKTLFPNLLLSEIKSIRTAFTVYDLDSRFTKFFIGSNEYEIHYGWILNYVIFATSHECLITSIEALYSPDAH